MTLAGTYYLPTNGASNGMVLSGAYVPMQCTSGYVLAAGQLNVTCIGNTWTTLPTCVSNTGSGSITATMMSTINGSVCILDVTTTFNTTNGYLSNVSLTYTSNTTAMGN